MCQNGIFYRRADENALRSLQLVAIVWPVQSLTIIPILEFPPWSEVAPSTFTLKILGGGGFHLTRRGLGWKKAQSTALLKSSTTLLAICQTCWWERQLSSWTTLVLLYQMAQAIPKKNSRSC